LSGVTQVPLDRPALAPRFSPVDGRILFTGPGYRGLFLTSPEGGAVETLDGDADGWPVTPDAPRKAVNGCSYDARADIIRARCPGRTEPVAVGGDRYYNPQLSPDGATLVFQGLHTGIYLLRLPADELIHVGAGNHPAWCPDSHCLLFDSSRDDGIRITASELFLFDLSSRTRHQLTHTPRLHEMRPRPSADGTRIVFDAGPALWVAHLHL